MKRIPYLWSIAACTLVACLSAMLLAEYTLDQQELALFGSIRLHLSHNAGIAFGLLLPTGFQLPIIIAALIGVAWYATIATKAPGEELGFGLIIGGGLSNVIDRLLDGTVTDYIAVGSFPVFNLADSAISFGVFLLLLELFIASRRQKQAS